jgi:hypothetical protein
VDCTQQQQTCAEFGVRVLLPTLCGVSVHLHLVPHCGHSRHRMAHFACTVQVQGYPTVKWFGENKNSPVDFDGGRDESSLTAYALDKWQMALPPPEVGTY